MKSPKPITVLGLRCSTKDFTFSILGGTKAIPTLVEVQNICCPKGYPRPQLLKWLRHEYDEIIKKYSVKKIVIKKFEGRTRGNSYEQRIENEAIAYLAAADNGINAVYKKPKSTIAKDLGKKGKAKYLQDLDTSVFPDFSTSSDKEQDALLAAWSELIP